MLTLTDFLLRWNEATSWSRSSAVESSMRIGRVFLVPLVPCSVPLPIMRREEITVAVKLSLRKMP